MSSTSNLAGVVLGVILFVSIIGWFGYQHYKDTQDDRLPLKVKEKLIKFHLESNTKATLTAVQPPGRFGSLEFERGRVLSFKEKPKGDGNLINGGFFVLEPSVIDLIEGDECIWEDKPLMKLAEDKELSAFCHTDFWQPMDTLRDKNYLQELWDSQQAPWKLWD